MGRGRKEASPNQTRFKIDRIIICPDQARRVRPQRVLPPVFRRAPPAASPLLLPAGDGAGGEVSGNAVSRPPRKLWRIVAESCRVELFPTAGHDHL